MSKRAIVAATVSSIVSMVLNILLHGILFGNMMGLSAASSYATHPESHRRLGLVCLRCTAAGCRRCHRWRHGEDTDGRRMIWSKQ
jgi:hypothetical protein